MTNRPGKPGGHVGGTSTTRVPSIVDDVEEARRAAVNTAATRYLVRTGNADVLPILGLAGEPEPERRCANPACGGPILSPKARARFCSAGCSATTQNLERRAARKLRTAT